MLACYVAAAMNTNLNLLPLLALLPQRPVG
jgi:hypothetical protein